MAAAAAAADEVIDPGSQPASLRSMHDADFVGRANGQRDVLCVFKPNFRFLGDALARLGLRPLSIGPLLVFSSESAKINISRT